MVGGKENLSRLDKVGARLVRHKLTGTSYKPYRHKACKTSKVQQALQDPNNFPPVGGVEVGFSPLFF